MKVLFFDDAHTFGGAQIAAVNMAKYIRENFNYEICFYCSKKNERLIERLNLIGNIEVISDGYAAVPFFILTHFIFLWKIRSIVKKLISIKPNLVIVNMAGLEFGWLYIYAAKLLGLRLICWLHNPYRYKELMPSKGVRSILTHLRDGMADIFSKFIFDNLHTVSNSSRAYLLSRFSKEDGINILGNVIFSVPQKRTDGINPTEAAIGEFTAEKIVLIPGRVSYCHKGQDRIIASLPELEKRSIAVVVVGDGEDLEDLKSACRDFSNVFFVGWQQSVDKYIEGADVVLLPSRYEAQPLIAMEVMTLQVPVLTSEIPSFIELVGDEFVVDFGDSIGLCDSIERICTLEKSVLSAKYQSRLELFSGARYKEQVLTVLRGV